MVQLPEAIDDDRLSDEAGKASAQPKGLPSVSEYYIHTIKLYDILRLVLEREASRTRPSSEITSATQAILNLDAQIMEWRNCLPKYLKFDPKSTTSALSEAAALNEGVNSWKVLGIPALSQRLYCRFDRSLHNYCRKTLMA